MIKLDITFDSHRIITDEWNYILQEKRTKLKGNDAGADYWANLGYYNSLQTLSRALVDAFAKGQCVSTPSDVELLERAVERQVNKLSRVLAKATK